MEVELLQNRRAAKKRKIRKNAAWPLSGRLYRHDSRTRKGAGRLRLPKEEQRNTYYHKQLEISIGKLYMLLMVEFSVNIHCVCYIIVLV